MAVAYQHRARYCARCGCALVTVCILGSVASCRRARRCLAMLSSSELLSTSLLSQR
jgi:hypothetical protein